jgi:NAD-dependent dihydropyrimidine dehydrogenase PreA subunit
MSKIPEISRRDFMKGAAKIVNIGSFLALGGFMGTLPILATSSGHVQSITCYECRACASRCPYKFDPAGFLLAGRTNNPDRRMLIQLNLRDEDSTNYNKIIGSRDKSKICNLNNLYKKDKFMRIKVKSGDNERIVTVKEAVDHGFSDAQLLETYEMKAKDAAFYCILCGNCDLRCPVNLPVTEYIRDLKENGRF